MSGQGGISGSYLLPFSRCSGSVHFVDLTADEVALEVEEVVDNGVG